MPDHSPQNHFSVRRRLFNAWISNSQTNLHLLLAAPFLLSFLAGKLLEASDVSEHTTQLLQSIGAAGLFILLLLAFLHQNLHGSWRFLEMFHDADHLPRKQLGEVSFFCMLLLLTIGAFLMLGGAWLVPFCWSALTRLFAGKPVNVSMDISDLAGQAPAPERPDLASLAGEVRPAPAWVQLLDRLLFLLGTLLAAALFLGLLFTAARKLYRMLTRRRRWDDDEKIRLTPTLLRNAHTGQKPSLSLVRVFGASSPDEKIRSHYRRKIRSGLRRLRRTPNAWETPDELEISAGIRDSLLHRLYEKARYSRRGCTSDDLKALQSRTSEKP